MLIIPHSYRIKKHLVKKIAVRLTIKHVVRRTQFLQSLDQYNGQKTV